MVQGLGFNPIRSTIPRSQ